MPILDKLTHYLNLLLIIIVILILCCGIVYLLYMRRKKKRKLDEDNVDYSYFNRHDSIDYIKIDDIKDNMVILDDGKTFVGGLKCQGFDLYSAQIEDQASTAQNFGGFVNTIKKPISYRQYSKNIDLEYTIERYKNAYKKVEEQLYNVTEDIKDLKSIMNERSLTDSELNTYRKNLKELEARKRALENREFHLRDEIAYCNRYNGNRVQPELKENWFFEWSYNPFDFPVELTKEEIYERAIQELEKQENIYRHALSSCNVKSKRCTTEELIEMNRSHSSPLSSDRFRLRDVMKSSYFNDIVSSNNVNELVELAQKKVEEDFMYSFEAEIKESISNMSAESIRPSLAKPNNENTAKPRPKLKNATKKQITENNI